MDGDSGKEAQRSLLAPALRLQAPADPRDYIVFRAVCSGWRACTRDERDPTLRKSDLLPRGWVALCDGDAVRPDDACEITLFHTRRARRLRVHLPELRNHRIIGFTQGLLILVNKRTIAIQVLHPFTRVVVDLPSLVPVFHDAVNNQISVLGMHAAVCSASATSIAVVVWLPSTAVVLGAEAGRPTWEVLHRGLFLRSIFPFEGRLYATMGCSREIMQLYPRSPHPVLARVPDDFGFSERLAVSCQIHDEKDRIRPSVRPFTIVDHLLTYCHPHEWTKGLMFHEYHSIPESFEELAKYIKAKNSGLHIPRIARKKPRHRTTHYPMNNEESSPYPRCSYSNLITEYPELQGRWSVSGYFVDVPASGWCVDGRLPDVGPMCRELQRSVATQTQSQETAAGLGDLDACARALLCRTCCAAASRRARPVHAVPARPVQARRLSQPLQPRPTALSAERDQLRGEFADNDAAEDADMALLLNSCFLPVISMMLSKTGVGEDAGSAARAAFINQEYFILHIGVAQHAMQIKIDMLVLENQTPFAAVKLLVASMAS
ncbi:hypothetical protein ACQ4PT_015865 [Festuca glaucescens]